jgi:hypothetical protein
MDDPAAPSSPPPSASSSSKQPAEVAMLHRWLDSWAGMAM